MQSVFEKMSTEEQKYTLSYNHTQSTNDIMLRHKNRLVYWCLKLIHKIFFSLVLGVMVEKVVVSKSVSNRAKISRIAYKNKLHQLAT